MRITHAQFRARPCRTAQQVLAAPHKPVAAYDRDLGTRTLFLRRVGSYQGVNLAITRTIGLQRGLDQYQDREIADGQSLTYPWLLPRPPFALG